MMTLEAWIKKQEVCFSVLSKGRNLKSKQLLLVFYLTSEVEYLPDDDETSLVSFAVLLSCKNLVMA